MFAQIQGILIGFDNLDEVICIIREASSNSAAAVGLRNGKLLNFFYFLFFVIICPGII